MPFRKHLLVVGSETIDAPELYDALLRQAQAGPLRVTLVVPARHGEREAARERLDAALARLREAGVEAEGELGCDDPVVAVREAWDPRRHDEVLVSTFTPAHSAWLRSDLPSRIATLCDCQVHHVACAPRRPVTARPAPAREPADPVTRFASLLRVAPRG
jgi:hypothetical protein